MDYGTNIESYLGWRGDIPFSVSPFSEIDAIVLCKLATMTLWLWMKRRQRQA